MLSASTNGIKDTNQTLQRHSGRKKKMTSFLRLYLPKEQNNGKKLLKCLTRNLESTEMESSVEKDGITF